MSVAKDELIVLSDTEEMEASESKTAETDVASPGFIPLGSSTDTNQLKNLSFKITEVKSLTPAAKPRVGRPKNIQYKVLPTGQRMKIVPPRVSIDPPLTSTQSTSQSQLVQPSSSTESDTSTTTTSQSTTPVSSSGASRKRKSTHVTKPVNDLTFQESVEVQDNENTDLMGYVACLRVALNNLLTEVDLPKIDLPGAVGKVKISDKVEQMINERKNKLNEEQSQIPQKQKPGPKPGVSSRLKS